MKVLAFVTDLFLQARVAESAKEAGVKLEIIRSLYDLFPALDKKPGLVLVDLEAEGIDGAALISQLKASHAEIPLVSFASEARVDLVQQAKRSGGEKVMSRADFLEELKEMLEDPAALKSES